MMIVNNKTCEARELARELNCISNQKRESGILHKTTGFGN